MSFIRKKGPLFLKEESDAKIFVDNLKSISLKVDGEIKQDIEKQIKLASYGIVGEDNIAFELKNSGMDIIVLHDLYFEIEGRSAQIDYIVITNKKVYLIECKNLIGNIEIDGQGSFVRTYELNGKKIKEGIYSPITQNQRHMQILKDVISNSKANFIARALFEKKFMEHYKSIVVLANPKTYLNAKFAKKEIKQQVIRCDQLIEYIKNNNMQNTGLSMKYTDMYELGEQLLRLSVQNKSDYLAKYKTIVENINKQNESNYNNESNDSKETQVISNQKDELLKVSGFGEKKVEKYGNDILKILSESMQNIV